MSGCCKQQKCTAGMGCVRPPPGTRLSIIWLPVASTGPSKLARMLTSAGLGARLMKGLPKISMTTSVTNTRKPRPTCRALRAQVSLAWGSGFRADTHAYCQERGGGGGGDAQANNRRQQQSGSRRRVSESARCGTQAPPAASCQPLEAWSTPCCWGPGAHVFRGPVVQLDGAVAVALGHHAGGVAGAVLPLLA